MFVSAEDLKAFTGKVRPSAQKRVLRALGMAFVVRPNGTIALRVEELDAHTLSRERRKKETEWEMPCVREKRLGISEVTEWEPNYAALAASPLGRK